AMARGEFVDRHIGPSNDQISTMLHELGYNDLAKFISDVLPDSIKIEDLAVLPRFNKKGILLS
ncbi:MAG: hypothetical protein EBV19_08810, partial [Flavobacteriia bacterium]|nr:hypothetical protein [Flavobacteriia bacterium]